jgi:ankyrin repeat protein
VIALCLVLGQLGQIGELGTPAPPGVMLAVQKNDLTLLKRLLDEGRDPDGDEGVSLTFRERVVRDEQLPVGWACSHRQLAAAALLLEHGADPSHCKTWDDGSKKAVAQAELAGKLVSAAAEGDLDSVQGLIKQGAWLERGRSSAMCAAAEAGHVEVMKALAKAGAKATSTALDFAVRRKRDEAAAWLVEHGAAAKALPLTTAAADGLLKTVNVMLAHGASVSTVDPHFSANALCMAAREGRVDVMHALLDHGAKVDECGGTDSPLANAVAQEQAGAAKLLLSRGADANLAVEAAFHQKSEELAILVFENHADIETPTFSGTPLCVAAGRWASLSTWLVEHGANVNATCRLKSTPLMNAAAHGNLEVVNLLLTRGADVLAKSDSGETALRVAQQNKHAEVVSALRQVLPVTHLESSIRAGDIEAVTSMIERGADMKPANLLRGAVIDNRSEMVKLLLAHGADATPALPWAATAAMSQVLLDAGAQVEGVPKGEQTALTRAAMSNHVEQAELLLAHGADVNRRERGGQTPLLRARSVAMVKLLLEHGANAKAADDRGFTALIGAGDATRLLLEAGVDPNRANDGGWTPLMSAAELKNLDAVTALLDAGAKIDAADRSGDTALMIAADKHWKDGIKLLLARGTDASRRDKKGRTAADRGGAVMAGLLAADGGALP